MKNQPPKKDGLRNIVIGQKMAEALKKISKKNIFAEIHPQKWQQEIRQNRSLPNCD